MRCERCFEEIHAETDILDHFHGWDSAQLSGPLFARHPGWSGRIVGMDGAEPASEGEPEEAVLEENHGK